MKDIRTSLAESVLAACGVPPGLQTSNASAAQAAREAARTFGDMMVRPMLDCVNGELSAKLAPFAVPPLELPPSWRPDVTGPVRSAALLVEKARPVSRGRPRSGRASYHRRRCDDAGRAGDAMILELSSTQDVSNYLGLTLDEDAAHQNIVDVNLLESLEAAREWLTDTLTKRLQEPADYPPYPARLHRACKMIAARHYRRENSIYGTEAFGLLGELGGVLLADPTIGELMSGYLRSKVGQWPPVDE